MQLTFRQAENKDCMAIVQLVDSAYRGETSRRGWTTEAELLDGRRTFTEEVMGIISAAKNEIILLEVDAMLLASVHIKKQSDENNNSKLSRAYLGMFAVEPKSQNSGMGKALMSYAENFARDKWHCTEMEMTVIRQRPELIAWYEKLGYRVTGESRAFPYGDERYGIPKRGDLVLDVLVKCF